jgi:hypothetical protein
MEKSRQQKMKLHNVYASPDVTRLMKLTRIISAGHVPHMGDVRSAYKILVGKLEGKRPLGSCRRRWRIILEWILGT